MVLSAGNLSHGRWAVPRRSRTVLQYSARLSLLMGTRLGSSGPEATPPVAGVAAPPPAPVADAAGSWLVASPMDPLQPTRSIAAKAPRKALAKSGPRIDL